MRGITVLRQCLHQGLLGFKQDVQLNTTSLNFVRHISEEQLGAGQDQIADLFERNMLKASRKKPEDERPRILTTRREAISLYREILRYSNLFVWKDDKGRVWRDVIRESARKEYEAASIETDPEIINKLIIAGRDCVQRTVESFMKRRQQIIEEEASMVEGQQRPTHRQ